MSIITKTGDKGTSTWQGKTVDKDSPILEAVGTLDELMAVLGIVMEKKNKSIGNALEKINKTLYQINGELTGFGVNIDLDAEIKRLEKEIEMAEEKMGAIHKFLEAGKSLDGWLNWGRTVARRVERRLVTLNKSKPIPSDILIYINRLSDYLFMLARRTEEE